MSDTDGRPLQIAERFKRKGNDALKRGPKFYDEAIGFYSEALLAKCNIPENESIYYSNRRAPLPALAARRARRPHVRAPRGGKIGRGPTGKI